MLCIYYPDRLQVAWSLLSSDRLRVTCEPSVNYKRKEQGRKTHSSFYLDYDLFVPEPGEAFNYSLNRNPKAESSGLAFAGHPRPERASAPGAEPSSGGRGGHRKEHVTRLCLEARLMMQILQHFKDPKLWE